MYLLDLFSGAGGLAEGFISESFIPIAHIEMDKDAINTLHTRLAYHYLKKKRKMGHYIRYLNGEISRNELYQLLPHQVEKTVILETLSEKTLPFVFKQIDENMAELGCVKLDVLIGGPPCQTYSIISRSSKKYKNKRDQRNYLYKIYAKILGKYKPKFFVFENVPGLKTINDGKTFKQLIRLIEKEGYKVVVKELDASHFGVLQKRTRLIITGWQCAYDLEDIEYKKVMFEKALVRDLLQDLSILEPGQEKNEYRCSPNSYLIRSRIRSAKSRVPLTQHMCRYHNNNDREIYREAICLWNESQTRLDYSELPPELITRTKPNIFTDKYKVVAGDRPFSHTVIAHIAKDGHYYIHPDLTQARSISVREAARLQSFPDDYYFEGPRAKKFTQIGNAVPPLLARQIARGIKEALQYVDRHDVVQTQSEVASSTRRPIDS